MPTIQREQEYIALNIPSRLFSELRPVSDRARFFCLLSLAYIQTDHAPGRTFTGIDPQQLPPAETVRQFTGWRPEEIRAAVAELQEYGWIRPLSEDVSNV